MQSELSSYNPRMTQFTTPFGHFQLCRFPEKQRDPLRAWNAADEYVLNYLVENTLVRDETRPLILNDDFGALTVALHRWRPQMLSDSFLAHQATRSNLDKNTLPADAVTLLSSLETPQTPLDLVIIKIPKTLAMLEEQLHRLKPLLTANTTVIGAAMAKHVHTSTLQLFETIVGATTTSLAWKKARLIFCKVQLTLVAPPNPYPTCYKLENSQLTICNHANVFSQGGLDIGSRFFLAHLPHDEKYKTIVDLGCGNGVVGLMAALKNPQAQIIFTDESFMAIDSAENNFRRALPQHPAQFRVTDCLNGITDNSVDLILNNPPFHQQHSVGDHIAWQMFVEAKKALRPGGELWVIGNRHLGYHDKLKRLFGNCHLIASNPKFVILRSGKK